MRLWDVVVSCCCTGTGGKGFLVWLWKLVRSCVRICGGLAILCTPLRRSR